jgi:hydrogenase maturation factor
VPELERLESYLKEIRQQLIERVMKLISEDAPKNKFSIVTGELKMVEEVESQIDVIKRDRDPKSQ